MNLLPIACLLLIFDPVLALYQQRLTIEEEFIHLQFTIPLQYLPIRFQQVSNPFQLKYGSFFHNYNSASDSANLAFNMITTSIFANKSECDNLEELRELIESSFLVSLDSRYQYWVEQSNAIVFNNPNDKFCTHHLEEIIRNFLPCQNNAGLSQLIDEDTFFNSKRNGMRVYWQASGMVIDIYTHIRSNSGIKKIKILNKCINNSTLEMTDSQNLLISVNEVVVNRLIPSAKKQQQKRKFYVNRNIIGNWYSSQKKLQLLLRGQMENNTVLTFRQILPKRAGVTEIKAHRILQNHELIPQHIETSKEQRILKEIIQYYTIRLKATTGTQEEQCEYIVQILMKGEIGCFDDFQSLFGGGTELASIPIVVQNEGGVFEVFSPPIVLRTPQPDQSLPFQVLTFVMAGLGYVWLAIWRGMEIY